MKKIIEKILYFLAGRVLKKYKPKIIGITGSIGKTSTKEAIYLVLKEKFKARTNIKNYNNELGVPLTILNLETGGSSIFKWIAVIFKACKLILFKDKEYPELLVIEMGADHPGDITYLTNLAKCSVGVLTHVAPVHLEFFKTLDGVYKEKKNIISHMKSDGFAVINGDEDWVNRAKDDSKARVITYGFKEGVDLQLYNFNDGNTLVEGFKGKILYKDNIIPFYFPNLIAPFSLYAILAAIAVGLSQEMNIIECINALKEYKLPKGRLQLLKGKNDSLLIDDSYNASPVAVEKSIEMLNDFNNDEYRKIFIIGDMLELGEDKEKYHQRIGQLLAKSNIPVIITVGQLSQVIFDYLKKNTDKECHHFDHSKYARKFLKNYISANDLYFVKGSQGVRMERISKVILAEDIDPKDVLPRQSKEWIN